MGKALSADLRERVSEHVVSGHSRRDAARRFEVSVSCAIKLAQRMAKTGSAAPRVKVVRREPASFSSSVDADPVG